MRYEKPLVKSFEDYLIVLTQNMKNDLILKPNMDQTWENYVEKLKSIQPNYQKILDRIENKRYIRADVVTTVQIF